MVFNFNIVNNINSLKTTYDYRSMMHYDQTAFGCDDNWRNCKMTIRTKDPGMQTVIGRSNGFSQGDIKQINLMYNCKGTGTGGTGTGGGNVCFCLHRIYSSSSSFSSIDLLNPFFKSFL